MSNLTDPTDEIVALYRSFLSAWNGWDFKGVANCFAEPAFYALPEIDIPVPDRSSFVALLEKVFAGLEADGSATRKSAKYRRGPVEKRWLS